MEDTVYSESNSERVFVLFVSSVTLKNLMEDNLSLNQNIKRVFVSKSLQNSQHQI